jgi:glutamine synthetase
MAVIAATMCSEVEEVIKLLDSGKTVEQVIESYVEQTRKIRFDGNGYSKEWREEAKKRGLYVNEKFSELYTFL